MTNEPHALMAELRFASPPAIDGDRLVTRVRERLPESELVPSDGPVMVAHPRYLHTYADGKTASIVTALLHSDGSSEHEPDTSQTYDWDEAAGVLARSDHRLLVAEMFGRVHPCADRIDAFRTTLRAAVAELRPAAVWCPNSTRVVAPNHLLTDMAAPFANVRMFRIENEPGVHVMDTLGLDALGLPDFQLHFRDLPPGKVASVLYNLAAYVLEHGDVIDTGHTVAGVEGDEQWRCRHEDALVEPARVVLDIDPGDPFAAGGRDR